MKQLLYLVASLIVIAAIIPAASAAGTYQFVPSLPSPSVTMNLNTQYTLSNFNSAAEYDAFCTALVPGSTRLNSWGYKYTGGYFNSTGNAVNLTGGSSFCGNTYPCSNTFNSSTITAAGFDVSCVGGGYEYHTWMKTHNRIDQMGTIIVNFTGSPLTGSAPLSVLFTAVNLTNTTGSSWSFGDGNITTSSLTALTHFYQNPGTYTVRLDYYNNSGIAGYVQKNNYITVGAPNATKTKYFQTIDGTNGNIVLNSSIQLKDIENSSWVNATGLTADGMSSITTLLGHTINAYAQSLGYSDADDLGILNDGQPAYIMMWPTFAKNVSEGNVSLYVTVKDKDTKANIVGAGVTASLASGSMSTTTNEAGIAYFIVKNSSMVLITAQAIGQGYQTATTTINTGTASGGSASAAATILLGKNTVIPTFTTSVTTLPGGGTPAPVITILPGCEDTISAAGQEKCRAAQSNQGLSFLSGNLLGLIQICFVVTILYLLGIKLGK